MARLRRAQRRLPGRRARRLRPGRRVSPSARGRRASRVPRGRDLAEPGSGRERARQDRRGAPSTGRPRRREETSSRATGSATARRTTRSASSARSRGDRSPTPAPALAVAAGTLVRERSVHLEAWGVQALAEVIDPELAVPTGARAEDDLGHALEAHPETATRERGLDLLARLLAARDGVAGAPRRAGRGAGCAGRDFIELTGRARPATPGAPMVRARSPTRLPPRPRCDRGPGARGRRRTGAHGSSSRRGAGTRDGAVRRRDGHRRGPARRRARAVRPGVRAGDGRADEPPAGARGRGHRAPAPGLGGCSPTSIRPRSATAPPPRSRTPPARGRRPSTSPSTCRSRHATRPPSSAATTSRSSATCIRETTRSARRCSGCASRTRLGTSRRPPRRPGRRWSTCSRPWSGHRRDARGVPLYRCRRHRHRAGPAHPRAGGPPDVEDRRARGRGMGRRRPLRHAAGPAARGVLAADVHQRGADLRALSGDGAHVAGHRRAERVAAGDLERPGG